MNDAHAVQEADRFDERCCGALDDLRRQRDLLEQRSVQHVSQRAHAELERQELLVDRPVDQLHQQMTAVLHALTAQVLELAIVEVVARLQLLDGDALAFARRVDARAQHHAGRRCERATSEHNRLAAATTDQQIAVSADWLPTRVAAVCCRHVRIVLLLQVALCDQFKHVCCACH